MSTLLNEVRNFSLDEGFSPKEIKMAIGIASDPRYAKGNMTGAVNAIEKMKKGLSDHPQVAAVLKRQNEDFDEGYKPVKSNHFDVKIQGVKKKDVEAILKFIKQDGGNYDIEDVDDDQVRGGGSSGTSDGDIFIQGDDAGKLGMEIAKKFRGVKVMGEAVSPAQQAAIAISKKEKGEKPKEEGNTFGKELKAARDKGEKTFVVSGKKYNVEDYDIDEAKGEPSRIVEPYRPEFGLDEISTFSRAHIAILKKTFDPMRDKKLGPKGQAKLSKIMDMIGDKKDALIDLFKADIPFVSQSAAAMLITKYNMKGDEINKLKEEVELDEAMYHHVLKGKVVASGSKSDMMKLVKKNGATVHKGADSNYILNSPGAKVGDIEELGGAYSYAYMDQHPVADLNAAKFSNDMINKLKKTYEPLKGKKVNPTPLMKTFDKIDKNKDGLIQLYKADIPFVSMMAMSRLMLKHNYKASDINKLGKIRREDFVDEKFASDAQRKAAFASGYKAKGKKKK